MELQGAVEIRPWLHAAGNIAFSRNRLKNFTEFIDDYDSGGQKRNTYGETDISFSPAVVSAATFTITPVKGLELSLLSKYVSKQFLDNTANNERKLDAYFTEDIRAGYSFGKKRFKNIDVVVQVANVFNTFYEPNGYTFSYYSANKLTTENYYFPMAGINWTVGLGVKF
jgi:iron complex outermembrane receptor protein